MEETEIKDYGHWEVPFKFNVEDYLGFVYRIEDKKTEEFYIGKKLFYNKVKKKPLKGKIKSRRSIKESNWKEYQSSSNIINETIEKEGKDNFKFIILSLWKSKSRINYEEIKMQLNCGALLNKKCLNGIINIRLSKIKEE